MKKNDNNVFTWAQSDSAKLRAPDEQLRVKGFAKGERPLASNINWIFKTIGDDLAAQRKEIVSLRAEIKAQLAHLEKQFSDKHTTLKKSTKKSFDKTERATDYNAGISRQICEVLKDFVNKVRSKRPDIPELRMPLV